MPKKPAKNKKPICVNPMDIQNVCVECDKASSFYEGKWLPRTKCPDCGGRMQYRLY